ncbi:hypothetical protein [Xenorhabdus santafensis]|uniref:hypothetical protein n=1 Tax=Xenorhabdus santafensis TaxID=2582833 RepID=UPI0029E82686|nr:hypothetical protein [Xenorhabdus sp. 12]
MKTEVDLIYFQKDRETHTHLNKYYVSHRNLETIVEKEIIIKKDEFNRYTAIMGFDGVPELKSEKEAALKLVDWMKRMSEAIENHWQDKTQHPKVTSLAEQWDIATQEQMILGWAQRH